MKTKKGLLILVCACLFYGGHSYGWWETMKKYLGMKTYQQQQQQQQELQDDREEEQFQREMSESEAQTRESKKELEKLEREQEFLSNAFDDIDKKIEESYDIVFKKYTNRPKLDLVDVLGKIEEYILQKLNELEEKKLIESHEFDKYEKEILKKLELIEAERLKTIDSFIKKTKAPFIERKKEEVPYTEQQSILKKVRKRDLGTIMTWITLKKEIGLKAWRLRKNTAERELKKVTNPGLIVNKEKLLKEINATKRKITIKKPVKTKIKQ